MVVFVKTLKTQCFKSLYCIFLQVDIEIILVYLVS